MFDFAAHKAASIAAYIPMRPRYETFGETLRNLLRMCLAEEAVHTIEARAKTIDSFGDKAASAADASPDTPKYSEPLKQITDLCGVRIIAYFPDALKSIESVIAEEFIVIERSDKSTAFERSGKLGYQSIHFLVRLRPEREVLREYRPLAGLVAEIQLRTILQHAWAEIEHDIQYKAPDEIPTEIRRRFAALAGLIEIADREFQAIRDADQALHSSIREQLLTDVDPASDGSKKPGPNAEGGVAATDGAAELLETLTDATRSGNYQAAIQRYTRMIDEQPNQHTLLLGRAKALFLSGDRSTALKDIEAAEMQAPNDPTVKSARRQIEEGVLSRPSTSKAVAVAAANRGHRRLADGEADAALREYEASKALGLLRPYCALNNAMAYIMLGDYARAREELRAANAYQDTPTGVNAEALRLICESLAFPLSRPDAEPLREALEAVGEYDYQKSPLTYFEAGMKRRSATENIDWVLEILRS